MSKEYIVYHTALINIIDNINSIKPKQDMIECLTQIRNEVTQNDDMKPYPRVIEHIEEQFNKHIKTIQIYRNHNRDLTNLEYGSSIIAGVKKERRRFDEDFFNDIISNKHIDKDLAKNFIDLIKEDEPEYYDTAIAGLLKSFKELPQTVQTELTEKGETSPTKIAQEKCKRLAQAQEAINDILEDFEILSIQRTRKDPTITWLDRAVFSGIVSNITERDNEKFDETPASECLKNMQQDYEKNNKDGKDNALDLIKILKFHMEKENLQNKPFPEFIRSFFTSIKEKTGYKKDCITFQTKYDRSTHSLIKDAKGNNIYLSNPIWRDYCKKIGIPYNEYKRISFSSGLKNSFKTQLEELYMKDLCTSAEVYLTNIFEANKLDTNVVTAAFSYKKYDTDKWQQTGELKEYPNWEKQVFSFLTKGANPIFAVEIHHDREQIAMSDTPNNINNFVLTLVPNENLTVEDINEKLIKTISAFTTAGNVDHKMFDNAKKSVENLVHKPKLINVHDEILHGASCNVRHPNGETTYFFLCPKKPQDKDNTKDTRVVAMAGSEAFVYDKTGSQSSATIQKKINRALSNYPKKER